MNAKQLAIFFHNTYEKLAPSFGYETREDTKAFDPESKNGKLMIAVCEEVLKEQSKGVPLFPHMDEIEDLDDEEQGKR